LLQIFDDLLEPPLHRIEIDRLGGGPAEVHADQDILRASTDHCRTE
jgi:hypothetical protein